ncbi:MAG: hypothetical protein KAH54_03715 [Candidatus Sabulitectum sp.]|nr:hypothetical protein [Candidatus Sabulitectum sp.]
MKRSRYVILSLLALATVILVINSRSGKEEETTLIITNLLPDITLNHIQIEYDTGESINIRESDQEDQLRPGNSFQVNIPSGSALITATDPEDGTYSSRVAVNDSTELLQVEISMADRTVFQKTIESGGEYWTGSGDCTVRITNSLLERDVYWLYVTLEEDGVENSPDRLGAFILYPGRTLNVRVNSGCYNLTAEDDLREEYSCRTAEVTGDRAEYNWEIATGDLFTPEDRTDSSSFILCNALDDWIITGVYHRGPADTDWSRNHLATGGIEPKEQYSLFLDPGVYHIRVEDEDNDTYTRRNLRLSRENFTWNVTMDDLDVFTP